MLISLSVVAKLTPVSNSHTDHNTVYTCNNRPRLMLCIAMQPNNNIVLNVLCVTLLGISSENTLTF